MQKIETNLKQKLIMQEIETNDVGNEKQKLMMIMCCIIIKQDISKDQAEK